MVLLNPGQNFLPFVKNDVIKQMGEQVTELVKIEIDDLEGYVSAVIEKTLAELKGQI